MVAVGCGSSPSSDYASQEGQPCRRLKGTAFYVDRCTLSLLIVEHSALATGPYSKQAGYCRKTMRLVIFDSYVRLPELPHEGKGNASITGNKLRRAVCFVVH